MNTEISGADPSLTPARRTDQLIVRQAGEGLVAYALDTHQVTELDPLTAKVWQNLDGAATTEGIARAIDLDELDVAIAVDKLDRAGLMAGGVDRRRFLRFATAAAGAMSLVSITAPTAMAAGSVATPPALLDISSSCANANNPANARVTGFVSGTGFPPNAEVTGTITVTFDGGVPSPVTVSFSDITNASGTFRTPKWTTGLVRDDGGKTYTAGGMTTSTPLATASLSGLTCS